MHGIIRPFVAWKNGNPVGRVAAILNRSHNFYQKDKTGFFGFFDCIEDKEIARALFDAASDWLKENGCDCARGPYNPSINDECGVIVEGFDLPPHVGTPWNPSYYEPLLLDAGFARTREMVAFMLDTTKPSPPRVKKILDRINRRSKMQHRHIKIGQLEEELEILQFLYNSTLDRNWGFVPITYLDLFQSAEEFRHVVDPATILFVLDRGRPAAFCAMFCNVNEILASTRKLPRWLRLPAILWKLKTYRYKSTRLAILGVAPEFRDQGLSAWLCGEEMRLSNERYPSIDISWIEANNKEIIMNSELMGAKCYRRFAIFEKPLGDNEKQTAEPT